MARKPIGTAAPPIPPKPTLDKLRDAAADCKACDLWKSGTQTVFGAGGRKSRILFIGEQPGNEEDLSGLPFVGPAGKLLDRALERAGVERGAAYVTNVVKHFKWEPRGKKRIHKKPNSIEIAACRPWLDAEIAVVKPEIIVCLGSTAAQALLGRTFRVTRQRGEIFTLPSGLRVMATIHPSSILRAPDDETRHREFEAFVADLAKLRKV